MAVRARKVAAGTNHHEAQSHPSSSESGLKMQDLGAYLVARLVLVYFLSTRLYRRLTALKGGFVAAPHVTG